MCAAIDTFKYQASAIAVCWATIHVLVIRETTEDFCIRYSIEYVPANLSSLWFSIFQYKCNAYIYAPLTIIERPYQMYIWRGNSVVSARVLQAIKSHSLYRSLTSLYWPWQRKTPRQFSIFKWDRQQHEANNEKI